MKHIQTWNCPECGEQIDGLTQTGYCPLCHKLLALDYLAVEDGEWIPTPETQEQKNAVVRNLKAVLVYQLPWDR